MVELYRDADGREFQVNQVTKSNASAVALWCDGVEVAPKDALDPAKTYVAINVPTEHGMDRAEEGDYIVKGDSGDFWPCKPAHFRKTYTKIE